MSSSVAEIDPQAGYANGAPAVEETSAEGNGTVVRAPSLPFAFAQRFGVLVTGDAAHGGLRVACKTLPTLTTLAEIKRVTKQPFKVDVVPAQEFEELLGAVYMRDASEAKQMVADIGDHFDLASLADSVPETEGPARPAGCPHRAAHQCRVAGSHPRRRFGRTHRETFEKFLQVRFRIDGVMREVVNPKRALAPLLVSRIKVMAKLDIAEKRIPQDGPHPAAHRRARSGCAGVHAAHRQRRAGGAEAARQASRRAGTHQLRHGRRDADAAAPRDRQPARHLFGHRAQLVRAKRPPCMRPWAS